MSKIFERVLYDRINNYLNKKQFFAKEQYGFRPESSTITAAIDVVTKIRTNIDEKKYVLGVFIDLRKAFDTVSHKKLLIKLNDAGIRGTALKMLECYLTNRSQVVKIDKYVSSNETVVCGIPQGSTLGPLLFLIYINNITQLGLTGQLTLYADDTTLFYFGVNLDEIIKDAQRDLNVLNEWMLENLLTINVTKTSFVILCAKNKNIPEFTPLKIDDVEVRRSYEEKYLGLIIDAKLTWKTHIEHVKMKLISVLGALHKASNCIPNKIRPIIYNSLVKSHIEYLIEIWGTAAPTHLNVLQRTQNKIIKALYHFNYLTPTKQIYEKTKILNLMQLYKYKTCTLVKNILTNRIKSNIQLEINDNRHNLRNKYKVKLTKPRTNYGIKSILFEGVLLFNKLPDDIKQSKSINIFKNKLKNHIAKL